MKFEIVSKYMDKDLSLPIRKTVESAGYDIACAEDTLIPPMSEHMEVLKNNFLPEQVVDLAAMEIATKTLKAKPTLVPTGIKCQIDKGFYLELSVRSSCPLKYWLILANGVGVIDGDYYNNESNEGEIFFQMINLSPNPILIRKGDIIGQGILKPYLTTKDDHTIGRRVGGFGSTSK